MEETPSVEQLLYQQCVWLEGEGRGDGRDTLGMYRGSLFFLSF